MDKEVLFARTLEKVKARAREQGGCISEEQVREEFEPLGFGPEQLQMVFDYLEQQKIGLHGPVDRDAFLTDTERAYLQDYLDTVEALSISGQGEAEAVTVAAMAGEPEARQRLVEIHLKDVIDIARLYVGQGVSLEDLIGEGNVALAAGAALAGGLEEPGQVPGMLARRVMDAMEACIQENAAGQKTDKTVETKVNRVADKARELAEELGRKVTPGELALETGLSVELIQDACRMSGYKIEDIEYAEDSV